ncbi:hypothetical protein RJT34_15457 [Clitoria ternatea]|uniref:C2 domain-containing protein n=1 Tax=Clitoria ternatea TaxID=43366 RepID=A0AAN9J6V3_CLITE
MATKSRTLDLTVLSAEDLRVNGKPANKNIFVAVRAESLTTHTTAMKDNGGGRSGFHSWSEKFSVELGAYARSITFEVKCKTAMGVVKDIGVARIALSDFLGGLVPDNCLQFLSYRLRDSNGLRNGIVNFSVRVAAPATAADNVGGGGAGCCRVQMGAENSSGVVVTGIPVWWSGPTTTSNV